MLTLREQLQHKPFRVWMGKHPRERSVVNGPRWRVYVQRTDGGGWAVAKFAKYADAYRFVAKNLKKYHDMALHCPSQAFNPPVVRLGKRKVYSPSPAPYDHWWCPYCRRMTIFPYFINGKHPALGRCDPGVRRCTICGIRLMSLRPYAILRSDDGTA